MGSTRVVAEEGTQNVTEYPFVAPSSRSAVLILQYNVLQRNDFYPFGKRWNDANSQLSTNRYLYNGKEHQGFVGLPYDDYGWRLYDPTTGKTPTQDKLLERYWRISPYAYCAGNPVRFIDPDGRVLVEAKTGIILYDKNGWTKRSNSPRNAVMKQYLIEMRKTQTGMKQFDNLVNNSAPISISFGTLGKNVYGKADTHTIKGSTKLISAEITIDANNNKEKADDNGVTHPQAIASTLGHEIRHTEEENIQMQINTNEMNPTPEDSNSAEEKDASRVEQQIINEYKQPRTQNNETNNSNDFWNCIRNWFGFGSN